MSYRVEGGEPVEEAVRRIVMEQIDKAVAEVEDSDLDAAETVHQGRKRCKKIRAVLRLTRPAFEDTYQRENAAFRDAARELAELRDATSRVDCIDELRDETNPESGLDEVHDVLAEERDAVYARVDVEDRLSRFRDAMREARGRVEDFDLDPGGFDAIAAGTKKTYRRGRKAMSGAEEQGSVEAFHEWRKRVKYHRYHVRLLRNLFEPVLEGRREALHDLSDLLGDAHDLGVTRAWVFEHRDRFGSASSLDLVVGLADTRRKELEARSLPLGRRLYADKPKVWTNHARTYWECWNAERELSSALER